MTKLIITREDYRWYSGVFGIKTRRPFEILLDDTATCSLNPGGIRELEISSGTHTVGIKFGQNVFARLDFSVADGETLTLTPVYPKFYALAAFLTLLVVYALVEGFAEAKVNTRIFLLFAAIMGYQFAVSVLQYRFIKFQTV